MSDLFVEVQKRDKKYNISCSESSFSCNGLQFYTDNLPRRSEINRSTRPINHIGTAIIELTQHKDDNGKPPIVITMPSENNTLVSISPLLNRENTTQIS